MEEESLEHFVDEVKDKCNILQTKLKSLQIATREYVGNTKSQVNDLWDEGGRSVARRFRPVTPANVRVLLRLIGKDIGRLRQRFERWKSSNGPDQIWRKQIENRIHDLEIDLQKRIAEIAALKEFDERQEEEEGEEEENRCLLEAISSPPAQSNLPIPSEQKDSSAILPPLSPLTSQNGTSSLASTPLSSRRSVGTCDACDVMPELSPNPANGLARRGILKRTRSLRDTNEISRPQRRSIPIITACGGDGESASSVSSGLPRSHKALSRRSMSDSTLLGKVAAGPVRQDSVLPGSNGFLRRERTMSLAASYRREFPRPSVVGYPFGSSFPELPPIWQLRRGRTMLATKKPPENME